MRAIAILKDKVTLSDTFTGIKAVFTPAVPLKQDYKSLDPRNPMESKTTFLNFWATWCPPSIAEMPSINTLYSELKDNDKIDFMMIDIDNNRSKSEEVMEKRNFELPVYTPASPIPSSYLGGAIPTTLVVDKYGQVVFKHEGMGDFSNNEFKDFLTKLTTE